MHVYLYHLAYDYWSTSDSRHTSTLALALSTVSSAGFSVNSIIEAIFSTELGSND